MKNTRTHGRRLSDAGIFDMLHRQYFIVRTYVAISILISVLSIVFEPSALHSFSTESTELPWFMFTSAIVVCGAALVDAFINDFLPNKYRLIQSYKYRHLIYMALSLNSFSLSAGLLHDYGGSFLIGRLWLDGLIATIVAVLDLFARHRENSWLSGTH